MDCPKCKLVSPPNAERCDCGYDFKTSTMEESYLTGRDKQLSKKTKILSALVRYVGEVFATMIVAGVGSLFVVTLYPQSRLATLFEGPTYLFFILAGLGLGYFINRRKPSRTGPWAWILPTVWFASAAASHLHGDTVLGYIWNTLILGNREYALLSQWAVGSPFFSSLAYSFGAWLALRRVAQFSHKP